MNFVSSEDLSLIVEHGVPTEPRPEFVTIVDGGAIQLTDRGRQLYRLALLLHGMSPNPVEHVRDLDGLRAISLRVKQMRLLYEQDAAERARLSGRVPLKARAIVHAVLHGTPEDLHAAVEQRMLCEDAGENVIPGKFRRRRSD